MTLHLRGFRLVAVLFLGIAMVTEIGVRLSGMLDFPLYAVDVDLGYRTRPNQTGSFLNRNTWAFNDRGMPIGENWDPRKRPNLLLIGNSIIMGGNPYPQQDKVGPLVQRELGDGVAVWPAAVGGWTQVNETAYLEHNADVVSANGFFVWEVMRGGFSRMASWPGEYVFPDTRPLCGTCYVVRRYLLPRILAVHESELPPVGPADARNVARFENMIARLCAASRGSTHGVLLLYPVKAELEEARHGREWLPERGEFDRIARRYGLALLDLAQVGAWDPAEYRADGTHPTAEGNVRLAHVIADVVKTSFTAPR